MDPSEVANSGRATKISTSHHRFRTITANKNCYRFSFSPQTVPEWYNLPDHLRSTHSVETFRAQLAQGIDQSGTKPLETSQVMHNLCCKLEFFLTETNSTPLSPFTMLVHPVTNSFWLKTTLYGGRGGRNYG